MEISTAPSADTLASGPTEMPAAAPPAELEGRGIANCVPGLRRLTGDELREIEPHCRGVAALHSPETGIVDFADVARALARELDESGTPVVMGCGIEGVERRPGRVGLLHSGRERAGGGGGRS